MELVLHRNELLSARAVVYSFISAIFSPPELAKFRLLRDTAFAKDVLRSCLVLDQNLQNQILVGGAKNILANMEGDIEAEYRAIFGHTLSGSAALYEMEHLVNKDVFAITQNLADISGFYKAFGLQVDARERPDHLAVEAEFLGFLLLKEELALRNGESENAEVCRDAAGSFFREHFSMWIPILISAILQEKPSLFYLHACRFLQRFLEIETQILTPGSA